MSTNTPSGTPTETSPTSTTTRSMASTPDQGLFSPGASPPLILAFLAIGLFTISMVAVFGWRRIQLGRGVLPRQFGDEFEFRDRSRRGYGEKPKLWDLWVDKIALEERDICWDSIMPIAVMEVPDAPVTHPPHPAPTHIPSTRHRPWPLRPVSMDSDVKAEPVAPSYTRLQIAVAIAMPSPLPHNSHTNHDTVAADKAQMNYMIGLYHYAGHGRGEG